MFLRLLAAAGLVSGLVFSAEQQPSTGGFPALPLGAKPANNLPAPLSSAIQKLVTGKWPGSISAFRLEEPAPLVIVAGAGEIVRRQCSIPLKEYKPPGDVRFFIQQMPVPRDEADVGRMPLVRLPVCAELSGPGAH